MAAIVPFDPEKKATRNIKYFKCMLELLSCSSVVRKVINFGKFRRKRKCCLSESNRKLAG